MIDISMLRISPKLISVELNRVVTDDKIDRHQSPVLKSTINFMRFNHIERNIGSFDDKWKGGRFPTQLFTNIKNDRYKYVKNIS